MGLDKEQDRPEVIPEIAFLGKLLERVEKGTIRVPLFQRPFVWKQQDMHLLLDSVRQGFPIGSLLVWSTDEERDSADQIGPIPVGKRPAGTVSYILDGQQRIATLMGTLRLGNHRADVHDVDWRIYFDLTNREFTRTPNDRPGPEFFPVASLLDTGKFLSACRRIHEEISDPGRANELVAEADALANAFRDCQIPIIHVRQADLDSAVAVFARLNRHGRKMTADQMVSALTYKEGQFHLAAQFDEFLCELSPRGFGGLDRVFILRAVLAALDRDIYAKDWANLMVDEEVRALLPSAFAEARRGLLAALEFLERLGVSSDRLLPYGLQIVLLGEFFRLCPDPSSGQADALNRWFWVTSFTGWFGGVNSTQSRRALAEMRRFSRKEVEDFVVVDLKAPALAFPERFDARSARIRAFLLYLASLRPRSLTDQTHLHPGRLLTHRGPSALGYFCRNAKKLGEQLFSSPGNRMFVDESHVGQALGTLRDLLPDQLAETLTTHGFPPTAAALIKQGEDATVIQGRVDHLVDGEREFMQHRSVTLPTTRTGTAFADSDTSDTSDD